VLSDTYDCTCFRARSDRRRFIWEADYYHIVTSTIYVSPTLKTAAAYGIPAPRAPSMRSKRQATRGGLWRHHKGAHV
jgi:hypothetical protein